MKTFDQTVRIMRDELKARGQPKDTDEIRRSVNLDGLRIIETDQPPMEMQNEHKHLLQIEAIKVKQGAVYAYEGDKGGLCKEAPESSWARISAGHTVQFDLNRYHNLKTVAADADMVALYGGKYSALHDAFKWVPNYVEVESDEVDLVLGSDWFRGDFDENYMKKETSPILQGERAVLKKFIGILERNKKHLEYLPENMEKLDKFLYNMTN